MSTHVDFYPPPPPESSVGVLRIARWRLAAVVATFALACEQGTTGLGDASMLDASSSLGDVQSGQDAAIADGSHKPDAAPTDGGEVPEVTTVVPCEAEVQRLPYPIAGGGPMMGELTVFVDRVGESPSLAGSRVTVVEPTREVQGVTDARGCVRFLGRRLRGPVDVRVDAEGYSVVHVHGLGLAQLLVSVVSAEALSGAWQPEPPVLPPPGHLSGEVTGWENMPTVFGPEGVTGRNIASLWPVYRRTPPRPLFSYPPVNRPPPYEHLSSSAPIVGDSNFGSLFPPNYVELVDFELMADAPGFVGLGALAFHESLVLPSGLVSELVFSGFTRDLTLNPEERLEGLEIALTIPLTRALAVELPLRPTWATGTSAGVEIYLPADDVVLPFFDRTVTEGMPVSGLPERQGTLADAVDLIRFTVSSTLAEPGGPSRRGFRMARTTRAPTFVPPPLPPMLRLQTKEREVSWAFAGARAGALMHVVAFSASGLFEFWDLGERPSAVLTIPPPSAGSAAPEGEVVLNAWALWPLVPGSAEVRKNGSDALDHDAVYWETRSLNLGQR